MTRVLDESAAQAILILAPAGFGKTSLACEWLADRTDVAWYRATSASADLAAFSAGIAEVVAPLVPGAGDRLQQRLRVAEAPEKAARPLAELLAEDLAAWPAGAWLVIDDYHLVIDSSPVEEFVDWLLTLAPIRLLVTTRRRPGWASARRVLYGELSEITKEQLAMTNEEAGRVLDGRPTESVRALVARAQGWPALIGLAALSTTSEIPPERVSEGLFRYFAEEVFRREPPDVQQFMLVASIPHTVNARIAREVLGVEEPESLLGRLVDEGLLQESRSDDLVLHPLLRDYLLRKLESESPERSAALADRAMKHARAGERWEEAFELAVRRGNLSEAAGIIGDASPGLLAAGRVETVEKWLTSCGAAALQFPQAVLAQADVWIRHGRPAEAHAVARSTAERLSADNELASRAWSVAGDAAHLLSNDEEALALQIRAREAAKTTADLTRALWGAVVASAELEVEDVERYLAEFQAASPDHVDTRLRSAVGIMLSAERKGSLAGVSRAVRPLLPLVDYATDPMIKSSFLVQLAYVQILRAQYAEGLSLALRVDELCRGMRLSFAEGVCQVARANAEIGLRQFRQAQRTINLVERSGTRDDDEYLVASAVSLSMKLGLAQGIRQEQEPRLPRSADPVPKHLRGEIASLLALRAAVRGDLEESSEHCRSALSLTSGAEASHLARLAELVAAVERPSKDGQSNEQRAADILADAIRDETFDPLVLAYRAYPRLLELFRGSGNNLPVLRELISRANDSQLASAFEIRLDSAAGSPAARRGELTRREIDVLRLMCEGLTNDEIAKRLFIAPSTAKAHVHHVLKKLGVRSRIQAVLAARQILEEE